MPNFIRLLCLPAIFALVSSAALAQKVPKGYKLVYSQDFESEKSIRDFNFTWPSRWLRSDSAGTRSLAFTGKSEYEPKVRSPHSIGIINQLMVGSFIVEADLLQSGREYGHRDMCVIFGMQDSSRFYYSHLASKMDDAAHQIMIVNNEPRKKITSFTTAGIDWSQTWHKVRVERDVNTGSIKVFYDGSLVQEANDKTFGEGYIGFGSFDDSGKIDNIKIWAQKANRKPAKIFRSK